ncbi:MAG: sigma-70 family RNA polymerase sigma factor [Cyanobacteria bacterium P01_D01_bin.56]
MHPRPSLIEIFAAFIDFQADRFSRWAVDPTLRRNFQRHQTQLLEGRSSESFWSLYWHARGQEQPKSLARSHLSAYLQEACYWSAQKVVKLLGRTPYRLSDCFQLASLEMHKVLAGYDPQRGASLKGYARLALPTLLRDVLRQRQEADICTDWTLLRRVGKQRLLESLRHAGLSSTAIEQYRLVWVCYKTLYVSAKGPTRTVRKPDRERWNEIATLYNAERQQQLTEPGAAIIPNTVEKWLTQSAAWIREYTYPTIASLNAPNPNRETGELQDELPDAQPSSLIQTIIELEECQARQAQQTQLNDFLIASLQELPKETQKLLHLYYCENLTQKQIAQQLGINQSSLSRRLSCNRERLLGALVQWSQTSLHISPTPDLIVNMSIALEDWLTVADYP